MTRFILILSFWCASTSAAFTKKETPLELMNSASLQWSWVSSVSNTLFGANPGNWIDAAFETIRMESRLDELQSQFGKRMLMFRQIKGLRQNIQFLRLQILSSAHLALDRELIGLQDIERVISLMARPFSTTEKREIAELAQVFSDRPHSFNRIVAAMCSDIHLIH